MNTIVAFLVGFLSCVFALAAEASIWTPQTSPTTVALNGVAFSDPSTWVAVGDAGTIVRTTDGGTVWGVVSSPVADQLHGVAFRGSLGLAVGVGGRVLRTMDGGANWTSLPRPTTKILFSVSISDNFAVITGEEGRIFVSTDDGLTWNPQFAGTASALFGVSAKGDAAVGAGGAGAVVMSTFRGAAWGLTVIGSPLTFFYGMSLASASTGWAVGTSNTIPSIIVRTDDGGFVWNSQTAPSADILFGVSFYSLTHGTAVGGTGTILSTSDGGLHWLTDASGVTATLQAVSFTPAGLGIAVGAAGTILRGVPDGAGVDHSPGSAPRFGLSVLGNPVRGPDGARFAVSLSGDGPVSLRVLDTSGRVLATIPTQQLSTGVHEIRWGGKDDRGLPVPAGMYFAEIQMEGKRASAKFIVLN